MPFLPAVKVEALVACGRRCCICHDFCGVRMECHHIVPESKGGSDLLENCIPLCFNCHADVEHYNPQHPKGNRYTSEELRAHRDNWHFLWRSLLLEALDGVKVQSAAVRRSEVKEKDEAVISEIESDILAFIATNQRPSTEEIAKHVKLSENRTRYYLHRLEEREFARYSQTGLTPPVVIWWYVTHAGRAFLVENDLTE